MNPQIRPNLFIAGAGKAGTYALYTFLGQHPDVFMSPRKEPNFFGRDLKQCNPRITPDEYIDLFRPGVGKKYRGEASVSYLLSRSAAAEVRSYSPDAKIIIMVRNPIEILQARHAQNLLYGIENIVDFEAALAAEESRRCGKKVPRDVPMVNWLFYREWVKLSEQIERYYAVFPKEQIFVGVYDDLKGNCQEFCASLFDFLGLRQYSIDIKSVNSRRRIRSHRLQRILSGHAGWFATLVKVLVPRHKWRRALVARGLRWNVKQAKANCTSDPLIRKLEEEYSDEIRRLGKLLNRDFTCWRSTGR